MKMFMSSHLHFAVVGCDQTQPESLMLIFGRAPYISLLEHFNSHFIGSQIRDSITLDLFNADLIGYILSKFSALTQ
jgi:hypothetical protein